MRSANSNNKLNFSEYITSLVYIVTNHKDSISIDMEAIINSHQNILVQANNEMLKQIQYKYEHPMKNLTSLQPPSIISTIAHSSNLANTKRTQIVAVNAQSNIAIIISSQLGALPQATTYSSIASMIFPTAVSSSDTNNAFVDVFAILAAVGKIRIPILLPQQHEQFQIIHYPRILGLIKKIYPNLQLKTFINLLSYYPQAKLITETLVENLKQNSKLKLS